MAKKIEEYIREKMPRTTTFRTTYNILGTMEQSEAKQKAIRLCELIAEAKQIISELEDFATTVTMYAEFKDVHLRTLPMPEGPLKARFINSVCNVGNIESLQDLLLTPVVTVKRFRGLGKKSVELAQQVIKENYGVEWK